MDGLHTTHEQMSELTMRCERAPSTALNALSNLNMRFTIHAPCQRTSLSWVVSLL
jgi:hypothetical protein